MVLWPVAGAVITFNDESSESPAAVNHPIVPIQKTDGASIVTQNPTIENSKLSDAQTIREISSSKPSKQIINIPFIFDAPQIDQDADWAHLDMPGYVITGAPGEPELYTKVINLKFKPLTEFQSIEFIPENINREILSQPLRPIQKPIPLSLLYEYSTQPQKPIKPNPTIYDSSEPYPAQWFEINKGVGIDSETGKSTLFFTIHLFPMRYIPLQNELMFAEKGTLVIEYTEPTDVELKNKLYENAKTHSPLTNSRSQPLAQKYDLLIISPVDEEFEENLTRLAEFKTNTDLPAKLVNITDITNDVYFPRQGDDMQEYIKYFIFEAKKAWDISYVILAGDANLIPHRNVFISGSMAGDVPADLYYADVFDSELDFCDWDADGDGTYGEYSGGEIDGTDMYPDVYLGRLPADNGDEIELLVDRIIYYEFTTSGQPWFDNVTMCGTNTFAGTSVPEGEYSCEYIADNYLEDFVTTKIYETTTYERDYPCTTTNIMNSLNKGAGFATFHDHGSPQSWAGVFSSTNAWNLVNGDKLPFLNFDACSTGRFDDQDCISERVVLNPNGGSITSIGASRIGWGAWGTDHINRHSGYFNVHLYDNYYNGEGTAGRIFDGSKIDYLNNVGIGSYYDYMTLTEYILFGDPSLSVGGIPLRNISISCIDNTSNVAPSDFVQYQVTVSNNGSLTRPIKLNVGGIPENWTAELNESLILVPAMGDRKVTLTVTASDTALYQQIANVEVFAYAAKNKARTISVMTHTITTRIYGIDLNTTALLDTVLPGEEAYYWFEVANLGNAEDIINLTAELSNPLPGWVFNFSIPDVPVQPFDSRIITIKITPPLKTVMGMYEVDITGTIFGQPLSDIITVTTNISRTYGIDLSVDEKLSRTYNPGDNFTYTLHAKNQGNYWDSILFSIQRAPLNWNITLSRPKPFQVFAFSEKKAQLNFEIPNHTVVGHYLIRLRAELTSNSSQWVEVNFEVLVNRTYGFEVSLDINEVAADPGETKEFNITINHLGNDNDEIEFDIINEPRTWNVNFTNTTLLVEPFETRWITVKVTPHVKSLTGKYSFELQTILQDSQEVEKLGMNITVNPIYGFEVKCLKNKFDVAAGDAQNYKIYVTNFGNHEDEISLNISNIPSDWNFSWTPENIPSQNIKLEPFNSSIATVRIVTDSRAIAGEYVFTITGKLLSIDEETTIFVYLVITPYYGVKLELDDSQIRTHPGEDFTITINITNEGNIKDDITRTLHGIPYNWQVYTSSNYTYSQLGPFEKRTEIIHVYIPEDEPKRDVDILVRVNSESEPELDDKDESMVIVEHKPKSEPEQTFNWNDVEGMFMFWVLPIILLILVLISMALLINKQRKEHKEDMEIIKQMREDELDQDYEEDISSAPGSGTPTRPGAFATPGMAGKTRRSKRIHSGRPPPPPPEHKAKRVGIRKGADRLGIDKEPVSSLPLPTDLRKATDDESPKIECTECGKMIGIDDYKCPYCGVVFEEFGDEEIKSKTDEDIEVHLPEDDVEEFELEEDEQEELEEADEEELEELEEAESEEELEEIDDEEEITWELDEE